MGCPCPASRSTASASGILVDERGEAVHDFHARTRRHLRPAARLEGLARRYRRTIDSSAVPRRLRRTLRPSPVDAREPAALFGVDELAVDEEAGLEFFCAFVATDCQRPLVVFAAGWMLIGLASRVRSESCACRGTTTHRRGATVRVDDHGVQVNLHQFAAKRGNELGEAPGHADRIVTASALAWRRLGKERRDAKPGERARPRRASKGDGVDRVGQRFDMDAAGADQDHRPECAHSAACRAAFRRPWPRSSARPRPDVNAFSEIPQARRPRAASVRPRWTPCRSLLWSRPRFRFSARTGIRVARGGERRSLALDMRPALAGRPPPEKRSASFHRSAGHPRSRGGSARRRILKCLAATRVRTQITVVAEVRTPRRKDRARRARESFARCVYDQGVCPRALAIPHEECRLAAGAMAAAVIDVAP